MSCGGGDEHNDTTMADTQQTTDTISSEVRINFDLVRVNVPKPSELNSKLAAAKINYNKGLMLSSGKSGSFSTNAQKAIGMGAFGSDLGLAAAYNQPADALEYLTQISKLANDIGIGSAFDPEFSKKILENIAKPDTFHMMLNDAYAKAERNMRSNDRVAYAILMVTGGWIEGLYTSVEGLNSNAKGENTKALYTDIAIHCAAFDYVFQLLEAYKSNADVAKTLQDLEPAKATLLGYGRQGWGADALPKLRETVTGLRTKIIG